MTINQKSEEIYTQGPIDSVILPQYNPNPTTVNEFVQSLNYIYSTYASSEWEVKKNLINSLLVNFNDVNNELDLYKHFDSKYLYTRNLVATDKTNYALLVLCWNPLLESKIHDHPCDGCFVKVLDGQIKETRYAIDEKEGVLNVISDVVAKKNDVTYMDNLIGLHKIGNPDSHIGAITLHLYTPPYSKSKVSSSSFYFLFKILFLSFSFYS